MEAAQKAGIHIPVRALFHHHPPDSIWPLVKFNKSRHAVGKHHDQVLLPAMLVDIKNAQGDPEAAREQVPLILAWVCRQFPDGFRYRLPVVGFDHSQE